MKVIDDRLLIEARDSISETTKILVYKENPKLFQKLDFENENIFLEPLLFTYFNPNSDHSFSLEQILFGYIEDSKKKEVLFRFDNEGVAYFPCVGYFRITDKIALNQEYKLVYNMGLYEVRFNDNPIEFTFEPIDQIDIYRLHKLPIDIFKNLFHEYDEFNPNSEQEVLAKVELINTTKYHRPNFELAITAIKNYLPDLYEQLSLTNSNSAIYHNTKVQCFQTTSALGTIFISAQEFNDFIFFIEEIIHQGSHNILEYALFNKLEYFKSDPLHIQISKYSPYESLNRSIYSAFHGLYTVLQRVIYYKELIEKGFLNGLTKKQQHEFIGRICDQKRRFRSGLQYVVLEEVYTEKGKQLYLKLDSACEIGLSFIDSISSQFDMSNQQLEFRYLKFLEKNPIEEFNYSEIISKLLPNGTI